MTSSDGTEMYHEILRGVKKHHSPLVNDPTSSKRWDRIEKQIADIEHQGGYTATPHEIP